MGGLTVTTESIADLEQSPKREGTREIFFSVEMTPRIHAERESRRLNEWIEASRHGTCICQILPGLIDLWGMNIKTTVPARKKLRKTERPMTTALFMLRCVELGLNTAELDLLSFGSVNDMFTEKSRDSIEWREEAFQADMDRL